MIKYICKGFQLTLCIHVILIMLVVAILLRLIGDFILSSFFSLLSSSFSENPDMFYFFFIF